MTREKHVRAHIKVSPAVYEQLKQQVAGQMEAPSFPPPFGKYEIRIDSTKSDEWCEIVDAHTVKPFRYIKLGAHFWWKDTLYVNPLDERLLP